MEPSRHLRVLGSRRSQGRWETQGSKASVPIGWRSDAAFARAPVIAGMSTGRVAPFAVLFDAGGPAKSVQFFGRSRSLSASTVIRARSCRICGGNPMVRADERHPLLLRRRGVQAQVIQPGTGRKTARERLRVVGRGCSRLCDEEMRRVVEADVAQRCDREDVEAARRDVQTVDGQWPQCLLQRERGWSFGDGWVFGPDASSSQRGREPG